MHDVTEYLKEIGRRGGKATSARKRQTSKANLAKANAARAARKHAKLVRNAQSIAVKSPQSGKPLPIPS